MDGEKLIQLFKIRSFKKKGAIIKLIAPFLVLYNS